MKYAWIQEHRDSFPVAVMCQVLQVSPSGYYDSVDREPSKRTRRHERIKQAVQRVHAESYGIYGSAKIADRLQQGDELESACRNTVATAMRELGIKSRVSKSFTPTTTKSDPSKRPAENKLDRDFTAKAPNRKWVTDITYLPTATGWVYLAVVLDLFGRSVLHWRQNWLVMHCVMQLKTVVLRANSYCITATVAVSTRAMRTRKH
jgi:putative transposase